MLVFAGIFLSACQSSLTFNQSCQPNMTALMPSNRVPEGSRLAIARYTGNGFEGINFLTVKSSLSVPELTEHYINQTTSHKTSSQRGDWRILDQQVHENMGWSGWEVTDECGNVWDGLLTVTRPSPEADAFVIFRVYTSP